MLFHVHYTVDDTHERALLSVTVDTADDAYRYAVAYVRVIYDRSITVVAIDEDDPDTRSSPLWDTSQSFPPYYHTDHELVSLPANFTEGNNEHST